MIDFIEKYENAISKEFCQQLILKFEKSNKKSPGRTGQGININEKDSLDITISLEPEWKHFNDKIVDITLKYFTQYVRKYIFLLTGSISLFLPDPKTGKNIKLTKELLETFNDNTLRALIETLYYVGNINLQKYDKGKGGYHHWHSEIYPKAGDKERTALHRVVLFMYYLNDVKEGGETVFYYQEKSFKPTAGTMLIAPCGFTHTHKGNIPISDDKYILTSWILFKKSEDIFGS
ncbi:MAG: prolyl 4-hydroxylase subunit alpha [Candidatus Sericytochromatia bacterium]|nr:MAG: prolyl 4-hydroxylase subunit alpha [Candidatus Sericytochromatia bacterium]